MAKEKIIYVKDKKALKFMKERNRRMKMFQKMFNPKFDYDEEYDIFYLSFSGKRKCTGTIEITPDIRFDIDKKLNIIGIEVEDFMSKIKPNKIKSSERRGK